MSRPGERGDRSIALFLLALLLFSPLFLSIFSSEKLFFGFPPLFLYLFAAWGGVIASVGWSAWRDQDEVGEKVSAKKPGPISYEVEENKPISEIETNPLDEPKYKGPKGNDDAG